MSPPRPRRHELGRDFWLYFSGQLISQVGSSFTLFALPLLVFRLTGSATNLALTTAANFVPYLLFGLVLGAAVDRLDRRRMMLLTDVARAIVILLLPVLALTGTLRSSATTSLLPTGGSWRRTQRAGSSGRFLPEPWALRLRCCRYVGYWVGPVA